MGRSRQCAVAVLAAITLVASATPPAVATTTDPPGTVVESHELAQHLWLPGTAAAHHVTYVSTGVGGQLTEVTGAVFVPQGKAPEGGWPVVSWAHGTVGIGDDCAPTVTGRSERDVTYLTHWMDQDYAIVATDYAGLGSPGVHPYLDGMTAAYGTIDMVRAAQAVEPSLADKWVVIGQSQGGQATLFTTNAVGEYAPGLDFRGGVATGPPSNLEYVVSGANPLLPDIRQPVFTAFLAYILSGVRTARPDFDLDPYLTELGKQVVGDAEVLCFGAMVERAEGVAMGSMLAEPLTDPQFFAAIRSVMEVPTSGYDAPFFIAQGAFDTVVWPPLTANLATELTASRQPMTFRPYPADHSGTMAASLPDTMPYVAGLFAG